MTATALSLSVLGVTGLAAGWFDVTQRRLPNLLVAALALGGLAAAFGGGGMASAVGNLAHAGVALLIGFGLFGLGVMGSGDGKYYAAVATWFPLQSAMLLLGWVCLFGFVLALGWLIFARISKSFAERSEPFRKVPFGVAIAGGAVAAAWLLP